MRCSPQRQAARRRSLETEDRRVVDAPSKPSPRVEMALLLDTTTRPHNRYSIIPSALASSARAPPLSLESFPAGGVCDHDRRVVTRGCLLRTAGSDQVTQPTRVTKGR
jgi:hypothetical protein